MDVWGVCVIYRSDEEETRERSAPPLDDQVIVCCWSAGH